MSVVQTLVVEIDDLTRLTDIHHPKPFPKRPVLLSIPAAPSAPAVNVPITEAWAGNFTEERRGEEYEVGATMSFVNGHYVAYHPLACARNSLRFIVDSQNLEIDRAMENASSNASAAYQQRTQELDSALEVAQNTKTHQSFSTEAGELTELEFWATVVEEYRANAAATLGAYQTNCEGENAFQHRHQLEASELAIESALKELGEADEANQALTKHISDSVAATNRLNQLLIELKNLEGF